jgi:signal transduction histidine kinase
LSKGPPKRGLPPGLTSTQEHTLAEPSPAGMPISWKLTMLIFASVVLVLGVAIFLLARGGIRSLQDSLVARVVSEARVVGDYSVSDLAFEARAESRRTLARLGEDPNIMFAAVYGVDGVVFSSYESPRAPGAHVPKEGLDPPDAPHGVQVTDHYIEVLSPIVRDGSRYGTIRVRATTAALAARIAQYWWTIAGTMGGLVVLALVLALGLQRVVSQPIMRLAATAQTVSRSLDTSVRVDPSGGREMAMLTRGFNAMLAAVQRRQEELDQSVAAQKRYADRLRILHDVDGAILAEWPIERTARQALEGLRRMVPFTLGAVITFDEELNLGVVLDVQPYTERIHLDLDLNEQRDFIQALGTGAMFIARPDRPQPAATQKLLDMLHITEYAVMLAVPLYTENTLLGSLILVDSHGGPDAKEPLVIAHEVAELLAVSLHQVRLKAQIAENTEQLEDRVKRRTLELEGRNRELEAFGYSVAHDLRSPLRAMQGYADALLDEQAEALDDTGRMYLQRIMDASTRMDALIHDLLDYSRLSLHELELKPLALEEVVDAVLSQLSDFLDGAGADVRVAAPLGRVIAHKGTLIQGLANLVTNGVKFVQSGEQPELVLSSEVVPGGVRLVVSDNGIGISEEHRGRIFAIFQRLHSRAEYPGTGIGLAIVRKGAERMGGSVGLSSEPGAGSRFWIELPAAT